MRSILEESFIQRTLVNTIYFEFVINSILHLIFDIIYAIILLSTTLRHHEGVKIFGTRFWYNLHLSCTMYIFVCKVNSENSAIKIE